MSDYSHFTQEEGIWSSEFQSARCLSNIIKTFNSRRLYKGTTCDKLPATYHQVSLSGNFSYQIMSNVSGTWIFHSQTIGDSATSYEHNIDILSPHMVDMANVLATTLPIYTSSRHRAKLAFTWSCVCVHLMNVNLKLTLLLPLPTPEKNICLFSS